VSSRLAIVLLVVVGALCFALLGGEYSTFEWLSLRRAERAETARIRLLQREVDSLAIVAKLVETDPETQERIAREQHGMLKKGEHAFILEAPAEKP
jgi:cell division protein FtsB